eukprot:gene4023-14102_t
MAVAGPATSAARASPMGLAHAPQPMGQVAAAPIGICWPTTSAAEANGASSCASTNGSSGCSSHGRAGQQPCAAGAAYGSCIHGHFATSDTNRVKCWSKCWHTSTNRGKRWNKYWHTSTNLPTRDITLQQSSMQIGRNVNQMMTMVLEASCHSAHSAMVQSDMLQQSQAVMVAQQRQAFVHAQPAPSTGPTQEQHTRPQGANPLPSPPKAVLDRAEVGVNQVHGTIIQMVHVRHNTKLEMKVITLPSSPVYDPRGYLELANTQVTKMWAFAINCNKNRCYWKGIVYALHMRVTGGEILSPVEGVEGAAQVPMDLAAAKEHLLATCNIEDDDEGVSKLARASADAVMNWAPKDYEKRLQTKDLVLSMCSLTSSEW